MARDRLIVAARSWVDNVLPRLATGAAVTVVQGLNSWHRVDETTFRDLRRRTVWAGPLHESAFEGDEFDALGHALLNDAVIAPQMNTLVGDPMSRSRVDLRSFASRLLPLPGEPMADYDFAKAYDLATRAFFVETISTCMMIPVLGVELEDEVILDESTRLVQLTDEELEKSLNAGAIVSHMTSMGIYHVGPRSVTALKIDAKLPKLVGDDDALASSTELAAVVYGGFEQTRALLLQSLALLRISPVKMSGWYRDNDLPGYSGTISTPGQMWFGQTRLLTQAEVESLQGIWKIAAAKKFSSNRALGLALRRVGYATQRDRDEDRLLDLLIAAEAFYLGDGNQELRYKLALRAALWNELESWSREDVFRLFQKAYDVRSKIAHGDIPKAKEMTLRGEQVDIQTFIAAVTEVLTAGLFKGLHLAGETPDSALAVEWDALSLNPENPTS